MGKTQALSTQAHVFCITDWCTGNAGSAMIGVEVGRSAWPASRPYVTLIPTVTFMTRSEVMAGQNRNSVRMFSKGQPHSWFDMFVEGDEMCD